MEAYSIKRRFENPIVSGLVSFLVIFIFASISWPVWSIIAKKFILMIAGKGLAGIDQHLIDHYLKDFVEGTFFWMSITAWVWLTLIFGNYGKYKYTMKQPHAGLWYTLVAFGAGILGFVVLTGFLGMWWKPFSWSILFTPKTPEEVELAIKGWGCTNFYVLPVLIAQIPFSSLLHKFPFAGKVKEPLVGFGTFATGTAIAILVWMGIFVPSFFKFGLDGILMVNAPFGQWITVVAWCQCFIFWFLIPAEGGELFPMKLFAKKQPAMGFVGLAIAFVGGHASLRGLRVILAPLAESLGGMNIDLVIASFVLTIIVTMLIWHHHFFDYPGEDVVSSSGMRAIIRIVIWVGLGSVLGVVWLKTYKVLPFGGNNFGMGYPMLGVLAGQFVFLMPALFMNTFFDKWPVCYTERKIQAPKDTGAVDV